ncbi:DUF4199 domain-containing protein [Flammeovirga yaeyamensis]|uniref:DUF4199 domain-containing protein n=1 Tax=Flammeovirga yaeyamensis TaxID=367791 RepID=A0AAX1N4X2_9BACT|nr:MULTISPECIES: DUF4199 domain-containing protein [Flammeovirga]ANQ50336.1 DUF4199 domain-containing protein [Flammeovirga sp. MY04]MBB3699709.1 hypothetical protein [Flammeovirga yaeyamensis]NMF36721.1 DUF4199 domain-containing protein [Flammeovirga yaeyamensis]QWG02237.1 DUF4199 domain-containing protein [Flammeovirga yaeyamensis]
MNLNETEQPNKFPVAMKYGAIAGVFSFVYYIFLTVLDKSQDGLLSSLGMVVTITAMFMAVREYKSETNGYLPFGQAFKTGAFMGVISSLISSVLNYVYITFIDDSGIQTVLEEARLELEKNPQLTNDQIDQAMSITEMFVNTPLALVAGIISSVIMSCIIALMIAFILKQENPDAV